MSEKLTMPKNVQAFVNKYGRIGSKEQDATFWKEFRKAANAYADVQSKRICDLEHALTTATEQRDRLAKACDQYSEDEILCKLQEITKQRDRLAEALETITITGSAQYCREIANEVLQSLTTKP
jgi:hypothetical protein